MKSEVKKQQGSFWLLGYLFGGYSMGVLIRLRERMLSETASLSIALLIGAILLGIGYASLVLLGRYYERT